MIVERSMTKRATLLFTFFLYDLVGRNLNLSWSTVSVGSFLFMKSHTNHNLYWFDIQANVFQMDLEKEEWTIGYEKNWKKFEGD